jgi:hypothetical protein
VEAAIGGLIPDEKGRVTPVRRRDFDPIYRLPPPDVLIPSGMVPGLSATAGASRRRHRLPTSDDHDQRQVARHCVRQVTAQAPRKAPPARVTIPVIVTAKKQLKVDAARRYDDAS